jgi:transcriptional regulator with XRE-family HTH domain
MTGPPIEDFTHTGGCAVATVPAMPPRRNKSDDAPMNALSRLIHRRKEELGLSWYEIAKAGGFSSHTIVYMLAKKTEHRQPPRADTLERLAQALDVPLDIVRLAAADAAGYRLEGVTTTLDAAEDVRFIAQVMAELPERDRLKLRQLAQAFLTDARQDTADDVEQRRAESEALRKRLSDVADRVPGPDGPVRDIQSRRRPKKKT